jgi:hypothetical protein
LNIAASGKVKLIGFVTLGDPTDTLPNLTACATAFKPHTGASKNATEVNFANSFVTNLLCLPLIALSSKSLLSPAVRASTGLQVCAGPQEA